MPIYEYRCDDCDTEFEKILLREVDPIECPDCTSQRTQRLISAFAVARQDSAGSAVRESGPCGCGAPQRGMCSN